MNFLSLVFVKLKYFLLTSCAHNNVVVVSLIPKRDASAIVFMKDNRVRTV